MTLAHATRNADGTAQGGSGWPARIGERYRVDRLIGEGGAAKVFEATNLQNGQVVAVKVLASDDVAHPEILGRFKREVAVTAAIANVHVVQVLDAGWDPACGIYLVMERLRGMDLRQYLQTYGRMHPRLALQMASQVAWGLAAAHAAGVVHRDLKPSNIFLAQQPDGMFVVKLVDFGIAKVFGAAKAQDMDLTRPGTALGTPQYMSPEQIRAPETVTHATDVYALGAVLYEALVGAPVIRSGRPYAQMLLDVLTEPTPRVSARLPDADAALDELVDQMMDKDAARRLPSMAMIAERLAWLSWHDLSWDASRTAAMLASGDHTQRHSHARLRAGAGATLAPHRKGWARVTFGVGVVAAAACAAFALAEWSAPTDARGPTLIPTIPAVPAAVHIAPSHQSSFPPSGSAPSISSAATATRTVMPHTGAAD